MGLFVSSMNGSSSVPVASMRTRTTPSSTGSSICDRGLGVALPLRRATLVRVKSSPSTLACRDPGSVVTVFRVPWLLFERRKPERSTSVSLKLESHGPLVNGDVRGVAPPVIGLRNAVDTENDDACRATTDLAATAAASRETRRPHCAAIGTTAKARRQAKPTVDSARAATAPKVAAATAMKHTAPSGKVGCTRASRRVEAGETETVKLPPRRSSTSAHQDRRDVTKSAATASAFSSVISMLDVN
mmetsp:Transcript_10265/g.31718  ORF Transcript_10265/g.31718 Transcript_10265/m.31718 type:complete len:245 (-) Transcript_10265:1029-1763(-)